VLVHNGTLETYVAEQNLEPDNSGEPVNHPLTTELFGSFGDGRYTSRERSN
jgi:heat shock protein HspQ